MSDSAEEICLLEISFLKQCKHLFPSLLNFVNVILYNGGYLKLVDDNPDGNNHIMSFFSGEETKLIIENISLYYWVYILSTGLKVFCKTSLYCV